VLRSAIHLQYRHEIDRQAELTKISSQIDGIVLPEEARSRAVHYHDIETTLPDFIKALIANNPSTTTEKMIESLAYAICDKPELATICKLDPSCFDEVIKRARPPALAQAPQPAALAIRIPQASPPQTTAAPTSEHEDASSPMGTATALANALGIPGGLIVNVGAEKEQSTMTGRGAGESKGSAQELAVIVRE
jgi:hypothetical protein